MSENQYPGIDARVVSIVKRYAGHLVGRYGITVHDLPDLWQQWLAHIVRSPEYQALGHPDFEARIGRLATRLVADEVRRRSMMRRSYARRIYALDDYVNPSLGCVTFADSVSEEDYIDQMGGRFVSADSQAEQRHDVEEFLKTLPPELRDLALLLQSHPIGEIPDFMGISRATVFRRLDDLRRIAGRFFRTTDS